MIKIDRLAWRLAGAGLLIRFGLFLRICLEPGLAVKGDSQGYLSIARNLLDWGLFSSSPQAPFLPETFRTPGYPIFLAALGALFNDPVLPAIFAQALLGAGSVILMWLWLEPVWGRRPAVIGTSVLAFDPVLVLHGPMILGETLYVFLLIAACLVFWRERESAGIKIGASCGLLFSAAAFVRPISLYLPLLLFWFWKKRGRAGMAFLLGAYLLPAFWIARNYQTTGHSVFSSVAGISLLRYPAAGVEAMAGKRAWDEVDQELRDKVDAENPSGYANDAAKSAAYAAAAKPILLRRPMTLIAYLSWGMVKMLAGTGLEMLSDLFAPGAPAAVEIQFRPQATGQGTLSLLKRRPWLIPIQILYMAGLAMLYILAGNGLRVHWQKQRSEALILGLGMLYFIALSCNQGYYRYRLPMLPFLAAAASAGALRRT